MSGKIFCLAGMLWLTAGNGHLWPAETFNEASAEMQHKARVATLKLLSGVTPKTGDPVENTRLIDNRYVLWGELFQPGRVIALVALEPQGSITEDTPKGLALARWHSGGWQLEQVIDIPIFWNSPSIPEGDRQFLPDSLPEKAFWVCRLGPARQAVLVVSTPHSRYRGGHFILEYDRKSHRLETTAEFSVDEPVWRDGYVVLTNGSGGKAWWTEELFYQIERNRLKFRGSLRTGSYQGDDFFVHVTFTKEGTETPTKWRFVANEGDMSQQTIYAGEENETPERQIGRARYLNVDATSMEDYGAYFLHKLAGVPPGVAHFDRWESDKRVAVPAKPAADTDVEVHGTPEVLRLLGRDKAVK